MTTSLRDRLPERLAAGRLPTPIEPLARWTRYCRERGAPDVELWVKRDDLTGFALGGNKVRKLEFSFARARAEGADTVVTCGGFDSNHCRATAFLARRAGLEPVLMLRTPAGAPVARWQGNTLLSAIAGARIVWVTPERYRTGEAMLREEAGRIAAQGRTPYMIPEGASDAVGALGFVAAAEELAEQAAAAGVSFDAVAHAVGSGGTSAGLQAGRDAIEARWSVVGVPVCDDEATFRGKVTSIRADLEGVAGLPPEARSDEDVYLPDGAGRGYGLSTANELRLQAEFARAEGILVDPCYTGKALGAWTREVIAGRFPAGSKLLFWHTGGAFANFSNDQEWVGALGLVDPH